MHTSRAAPLDRAAAGAGPEPEGRPGGAELLAGVTVRIRPGVAREIERHAREAYPREACGLLLGPSDASTERAFLRTVVRAPNVAPPESRRFQIEPAFFRGVVRASAPGEGIVGVYHSHPDGAPWPSAADREDAWPGYVYLILGVRPARPSSLRAFEFDGSTGRFGELSLDTAQERPEARRGG